MNKIEFMLNGEPVAVEAEPTERLLDILRVRFGLIAAKEGCGEGECGACSVLKDGKLVNSCILPLGAVAGSRITTLEGLREREEGDTIIQAFVDSGAVQCGFCTPGMVMAAAALMRSIPEPDEEQIREALSGNLCRCTGYTMLVEGVKLASQRGKELGIW
jgi:aerobic carbon-monoxide dehydrogenase small subunit